MEILEKHLDLKRQLEFLHEDRRNEILSDMLENDDEYKNLCRSRKNSSIALKNAIFDTDIDRLFEEYSDAAYEQDAYELDSIYKKAVNDTLSLLSKNGLI